MAEPRRYHCIGCRKRVTATSDNHYRKHDREKGGECSRSKRDIPTWLLRRGPETGPETDTPVKGRDYADCPQCDASPVLDGATGRFTDHMREGETPTSPRVPCPGSGTAYVSEGEECRTGSGIAAGPSPATTTPPGQAPTQDAATAKPGPNEPEEMISKWAATAREIDQRNQSPESSSTSQDSPPRPNASEAPPAPKSAHTDGSSASAPTTDATEALTSWTKSSETGKEAAPAQTASPATSAVPADAIPQRPCHIAKDHGPHKWMHERRQAQCPGKPSAAERGAAAVMRLSRKSAPTPDATPADSAAPVAAGVPEAATREVQKVMSGATVECDSTPIPFLKDAARTSTRDAEPSTAAIPTTPADARPSSSPFAQPGSPFSQPAKPPAAVPAVPMTVMAERLVARMREIFYSYGNRKTDDNRSAQATLGPSEIGSPCDRRLAMSLLRIPPVNPGTDGWASFKGTAIHKELAEVFTWASGNTGRFAVEVPLTFPSDLVPRGTSDLLDRVLFMVDDHKIQGRWSQNKLKTEGMTPTQRVQLHGYGLGQRIKGERVDYVAVLSWPMESSTLDDMYAVVEPYDPAIARDALARVDRIAAEVQAHQAERGTWAGLDIAAHHLGIAREFTVADDCVWCPFHAPGDPDMTRGCPGRA